MPTTFTFRNTPKEFFNLFEGLIKTEEDCDGNHLHYLFISSNVSPYLIERLARHLGGSFTNADSVSVYNYIIFQEEVEEMINYFEKPSVDFLCDCLERVV